jgi:hypothetical protein
MAYVVTIETVPARILAAVRRRVHAGEVATAFRPALDQVWAFLRSNPGLRTDGHNVFHYDHASGNPTTGFDVDFGVEVTRIFDPHGNWFSQNGEKIGAWSQEIYGDWQEDESKLETTIVYALA